MKCPHCQAWTETLETRTLADGTRRRRYECANLHRFSSVETVVDLIERRTNRTAPQRAQAVDLAGAGLSKGEIARRIGTSRTNVRNWLKKHGAAA